MKCGNFRTIQRRAKQLIGLDRAERLLGRQLVLGFGHPTDGAATLRAFRTTEVLETKLAYIEAA